MMYYGIIEKVETNRIQGTLFLAERPLFPNSPQDCLEIHPLQSA